MKVLYVIVWVHHGLIQKPEFYHDEKDAEHRKEEIKMTGFNEDYDEIKIFQCST